MSLALQAGGREILVSGRVIRIARPSLDIYEALDDPDPVLAALRSAHARIDLFTFMQTALDATPKYPYAMEWDNVAALPVSTFDRWWTEQINDKTRNMVRLAEKKGVVVREVPFDDALVRGIASVYDESPIRQGRRFWHHGKDVDTVRRENGTFCDRSIFIAAFLERELVGFAKLVCDAARRQAGLMQILAMLRHRDKAPANALIAQAVRSCAERGIGHLVYARFAYARKARDGLSDFKQHSGFRRVDVPRYYLPLTPLGRVALRLGAHHPLVHRVPEPLLAHLREGRRRWYGRRLRVAKG